MSHAPSLLRRLWAGGPILAVALFLILCTVAAFHYPGGTKFDATREGFSMMDNYWCDLLDEPTYGGHSNPVRPLALIGILILCAGLSVLWWRVPALFSHAPRRALLVRATGILSGGVIPLVATPYHDVGVNLAMLIGLIAFSITLSAFKTRGGPLLFRLGLLTYALIIITYGAWQTGLGLDLLPLLQKIAFASFLTWMVFTTRRLGTR